MSTKISVEIRTGKVERTWFWGHSEPDLDPSSALLNSMTLGKVPGLDFLFLKIEIIIVLLFQTAARVTISVRYQGSRA